MRIIDREFVKLYQVTCPEHDWLTPAEVEAPSIRAAEERALEVWKEQWPQLRMQTLYGSQELLVKTLTLSDGTEIDCAPTRRRVTIGD